MNAMKVKALETFEVLHNMLIQQSQMHSDTLQDVCSMKSFLANQKEVGAVKWMNALFPLLLYYDTCKNGDSDFAGHGEELGCNEK